MVYRQRKTVHIVMVFATIAAVCITASSFIRSNIKMSSYSVVLPEEKWLITLGGSGQVISNLLNNTHGQTTQYSITQFERGEFVAMNFANSISGKREFAKGDTVISMNSSYVKDQLVDAFGELQVATAKFKSLGSAEKEPLLKEAQTRLAYVEEKIGEQKILSERTKQLFEKGYSSQQEFELQKWNLDLLLIEKEIYRSQLENLKTGVKPEELEYIKSEINSLEARMGFLKERESQLVITSPINGKIVTSLSPDTLLNVVNFRRVVLNVPIKLTDYKEFKPGQTIPLNVNGDEKTLTGTVFSIDREVKIINQQQVVLVSILVDNSSDSLLPGMVTEITLQLREVSLLQQLIRFFVQ